jgi:hypothetical protein
LFRDPSFFHVIYMQPKNQLKILSVHIFKIYKVHTVQCKAPFAAALYLHKNNVHGRGLSSHFLFLFLYYIQCGSSPLFWDYILLFMLLLYRAEALSENSFILNYPVSIFVPTMCLRRTHTVLFKATFAASLYLNKKQYSLHMKDHGLMLIATGSI